MQKSRKTIINPHAQIQNEFVTETSVETVAQR